MKDVDITSSIGQEIVNKANKTNTNHETAPGSALGNQEPAAAGDDEVMSPKSIPHAPLGSPGVGT